VDGLGYDTPIDVRKGVDTVVEGVKADWMVEYAKCELYCYLFVQMPCMSDITVF
jgi:hypothetical protein